MSNRVQIVLIAGLAGAGKTTIGKVLARDLGYAYFDKDTFSKDFVDYLLVTKSLKVGDRSSKYYTDEINPLEYKSLMDCVVENAKLGISSIVVAPFLAQLQNKDWVEYISNRVHSIPNTVIRVVWVKTSRDTEYRRLLQRGSLRDAEKLQNWDEYCEKVEGLDKRCLFTGMYTYSNDMDSVDISNNIDKLKNWITV